MTQPVWDTDAPDALDNLNGEQMLSLRQELLLDPKRPDDVNLWLAFYAGLPKWDNTQGSERWEGAAIHHDRIEEFYENVDYEVETLIKMLTDSLRLCSCYNRNRHRHSDYNYFGDRKEQLDKHLADTYNTDYNITDAFLNFIKYEHMLNPVVMTSYFAHRLMNEFIEQGELDAAYECLPVLIAAELACSTNMHTSGGYYYGNTTRGTSMFMGAKLWDVKLVEETRVDEDGTETLERHWQRYNHVKNAAFYLAYYLKPSKVMKEDWETLLDLFRAGEYRFHPMILNIVKTLSMFRRCGGKAAFTFGQRDDIGTMYGTEWMSGHLNKFLGSLFAEFPGVKSYIYLEEGTYKFYHDVNRLLQNSSGSQEQSTNDLKRELLDLFVNC